MSLALTHTKLEAYVLTRTLVLRLYKLSGRLPAADKYALTTQMRRASVSILLNIAEGCARRTLNEQRRFLEIARASLIEVDAALDISVNLGLFEERELKEIDRLIGAVFRLLSGMIRKRGEPEKTLSWAEHGEPPTGNPGIGRQAPS